MQLTEQHRQRLASGCQQLGLSLLPQQLQKIEDYLANLLKWNKAYNLTAIREPGEMVVKHLLDSLAIHRHIMGRCILDVGTGPGLPGIPVSICDTNRDWTLVDSNGKKTRFLIQMKAELALHNLEVVKGRIENLPQTAQYDVITSRAFSSLPGFVGVCLPLLAPGGSLLAMKGTIPVEEIRQLDFIHGNAALDIDVIELNVPFLNEERHLIVVKQKLSSKTP